ncbi:MAG: GHKL domain-containing protein, partial [Kofleriaceae bacterium]|nr:GHKL domain-containing protein [Kofleriaceae bacterium]
MQESIEGVEHIARIVRELKTFGRGKQDLIEPLDIEAVLDHAVRILGNETELTAAFTRSYGAAEKVRGMPGRLLQVFINLIKNAAQALPDHGGTIDLSTASHGDEVVVVVTDNGEGISCEALDRVFEPFYTTKEVGQGTGLGLSLCKSIIEEHGGRIRIESELGKGTRIKVFLPRFKGGAAVMQAAAPVPSGELRRRHVLCIDDDTRLLNMYQRMFKKQHDIKIASSGADALEMLESFDGYDVIICDLMMP